MITNLQNQRKTERFEVKENWSGRCDRKYICSEQIRYVSHNYVRYWKIRKGNERTTKEKKEERKKFVLRSRKLMKKNEGK